MLHDMPVGLVPGTAGLVPGLVAVSSPPDSVAIRRFSSSSPPSLQHGGRRLYTNLRPHTLSDRSPPHRRYRLVAGCPRPTGLCRHRPAGLCRHCPAGLCRHRPAGLCRHRRHFSSAYHLFEAFNIRHFGCYVQKCKPNKMADVGRMSTQMYSKDRSL